MNHITKNLYLSTLTCPTYGWVQKLQPIEPTSPSDQLRIEEGIEIQSRARLLYPNGVLVSGDNIYASKTTQKLLSNPTTQTIFEATFLIPPYITKADILLKNNLGLKIIEIKSAVNLDEKLIDDISYTTMVAKKAGLDITSCSILLVNKDYRLGMNDKDLFVETDVSKKVFNRIIDFEESYENIAKILLQKEKPIPELKWECKNCEIFSECCGRNIENHIFNLPRISYTKFCQLKDMGIIRIEDIPEDYELTIGQDIVWEAVVNEEPVIDRKELKEALNSIVHPCYYLDFETVQTCIPLFKDIAPYGQIPTQYSLHICSEIGKVVEHKEYLADADRDCRRELAEKLIRDCGSKGSIVVYSSFEKTVINGLVDTFPDLKKELGKLVCRLVDLHKIIKNNYYDVRFRGSYSIKKVLPVLVPELGYENMEIGNGLDASAVFAFMCMGGRYDREEVGRIREQLKIYCGLDTMAMVRLVRELFSIID